VSDREFFLSKLDEFLSSVHVTATLGEPMKGSLMKQKAVTSVSRQQLLDKFFSAVIARVSELTHCGIKEANDRSIAKQSLPCYYLPLNEGNFVVVLCSRTYTNYFCHTQNKFYVTLHYIGIALFGFLPFCDDR